MCFSIIVYQGVNYIGYNILEAEENPEYIAYTTPLYMVSSMANDGVEFPDEDRKMLEQVATLEEWSSYYNKYWLDDVARDYGKIGEEKIEKIVYLMDNEGFKGSLIKINWHLVTKHPVKYTQHLLDASSLVWEISRPVDGYEWSLPSDKRDGIKYKSGFLVTAAICNLTKSIPLWNSISWRGCVALFVLLSLVAFVIEKKNWKMLSILAPIVIWEMMFMISCYAQDSRYVLPAIEIATFLAVVIPMEGK